MTLELKTTQPSQGTLHEHKKNHESSTLASCITRVYNTTKDLLSFIPNLANMKSICLIALAMSSFLKGKVPTNKYCSKSTNSNSPIEQYKYTPQIGTENEINRYIDTLPHTENFLDHKHIRQYKPCDFKDIHNVIDEFEVSHDGINYETLSSLTINPNLLVIFTRYSFTDFRSSCPQMQKLLSIHAQETTTDSSGKTIVMTFLKLNDKYSLSNKCTHAPVTSKDISDGGILVTPNRPTRDQAFLLNKKMQICGYRYIHDDTIYEYYFTDEMMNILDKYRPKSESLQPVTHNI